MVGGGRKLARVVPLLVLSTLAAGCGAEEASGGDATTLVVTTVSLSSTTSSSDVDTTTTSAPVTSPTTEAPAPSSTVGETALDRCYSSDDGITAMNMRLRLDTTAFVGQRLITIANDEAGYYTSALERLAGRQRSDGAWDVDVTTWIEYDEQFKNEVWSVDVTGASLPAGSMAAATCSVVDPLFDGVVPLGATYFDGLVIRADERVSFDPGAIADSISGAVISGERDLYRIEASGGQEMTIEISSVESNAVFDLIGPAGTIEATESGGGSFFLPHSGDYLLIVGPSRGNATYEATITIV